MATTIKATKTLHNGGQCFTKGETYEVSGNVEKRQQLIDKYTTNDLKESHKIGNWWHYFKIV
jgi:hypothetical protein